MAWAQLLMPLEADPKRGSPLSRVVWRTSCFSVSAIPLCHYHQFLSYQNFKHSNQSFVQFIVLQQIRAQVPSSNAHDSWSCSWNFRQFSYAKMYKHLMGQSDSSILFKWIWKCASRIRHKIFLSIVMHDIINTRNLLERGKFNMETYECVLCSEAIEETALHILWDYTFAQACWEEISLNRDRCISVIDKILLMKQKLPEKIATDIIIMG